MKEIKGWSKKLLPDTDINESSLHQALSSLSYLAISNDHSFIHASSHCFGLWFFYLDLLDIKMFKNRQ